jgi:DNA polymerase-3 subunit beta
VLRFVATDGHRLALVELPAPCGSHNIPAAIFSRAFVADAIKATNKTRDAFKHVRLAIGPSHASLIDWDGNVIDGALVDGSFPDYERAIPRGEPQHGTATIAREPFLRAVDAATAFAEASAAKGQVVPALRFGFAGDKLTVCAAIEGDGPVCRGSASVSVDIAATTMTVPREIGFHGPQVLDILKSLRGREVRFDFFDVGGPNNFIGDRADGHALHVIMPARV